MRRTALLFSALLAFTVSAAFADSIQVIQTGSVQLTNGVWVGRGTTPNLFVGDSYFQFFSNPSGSLDFTTGRFSTMRIDPQLNGGIQSFDVSLYNISFNPKTDTLKASFAGVEWGWCGPSLPLGCIIQFSIDGTFTEHINFANGTMGPGVLSSASPFLTPEPGTFGLMGTGLFVVLGALRPRLWSRSSGLQQEVT